MQSLLVSELLLSECPTKTALHLIATNDTRRCTSCFTWFMNLPSVAENRSLLSSSLHADLQRWIAGRARDTCPTCQGEKAALAQVKEKRILTAEIQAKENASTRRYRARRDVDLYQALRAFGSTLPALPPRAYSDINSLLTWRQERALFHALQELGAFRYPGMAEDCFCDGVGGSVSDEKIYEIIRRRDVRWNMYRGWVKDGLRVSFEVPSDEEPSFQEPQNDHDGRAAKRWRGRGMYRKWAPRMDRGDFELEPIAEGDEMEASLEEMWSYRILHRTESGLMGKESKPAKNFSRLFGIQEERPKSAVVGCAEATRQVQRVSVSRREVVGSSGGRRKLTKAAP